MYFLCGYQEIVSVSVTWAKVRTQDQCREGPTPMLLHLTCL